MATRAISPPARRGWRCEAFRHDAGAAPADRLHRENRSGYGAALSWTMPNNLVVKASYARKLGSQDATSAPDRSGRFWFQIAKLF